VSLSSLHPLCKLKSSKVAATLWHYCLRHLGYRLVVSDCRLSSRWSVAACDGSISLEGKRYEAEANGQKLMVNGLVEQRT
jgi:hypothetical protein